MITLCAVVFGLFAVFGSLLVLMAFVLSGLLSVGYATIKSIETYPRTVAVLAAGVCPFFFHGVS